MSFTRRVSLNDADLPGAILRHQDGVMRVRVLSVSWPYSPVAYLDEAGNVTGLGNRHINELKDRFDVEVSAR